MEISVVVYMQQKRAGDVQAISVLLGLFKMFWCKP